MTFRAIALCSVLFASAATSAAPDFDYAVSHQRVDIGGRKLNLFCAGEGAPTVVFEAPGAFGAWNWFKVHGKVAARTRACVYDRAGYGFSDPSGRPADSKNAVEDLHALLTAAKVPGPYLLVASSYGAMHAQLYAYSYPAEVAGLVLVDGENEDEDSALDAVTGGKMTQFEQQAARGSRLASSRHRPGRWTINAQAKRSRAWIRSLPPSSRRNGCRRYIGRREDRNRPAIGMRAPANCARRGAPSGDCPLSSWRGLSARFSSPASRKAT